MRYLSIILAITAGSISLIACHSSTESSFDKIQKNSNKDRLYNQEIELIQGSKVAASNSINQPEFLHQYHLKSTWWNEAFDFLKTQDLRSLPPGKYIIDSGNVIATVWEGIPKSKDSVLWEAHKDFNDLQYIISGNVDMGITPFEDENKIVTEPYSAEEDIEHFVVQKGDKYYPADSTSYFIFSPKEIHRPAINISGNRTIKKIVIKVRVPDPYKQKRSN